MTRFYNYINEKFKPTGKKNTDAILKQMEQWKSDLRKITKIYKSLEYPNDSKEVRKGKEFYEIVKNFQENFYEGSFQYILNKGDKNEGPEEREFRKQAGTAYINFTIHDLLPDTYDRESDKFGWDVERVLKERKSIINKYNRHFRNAFKALNDLLEEEEGGNKRIDRIRDFNYGGVNIKIKGEPSKFIVDATEEFIKRLKSFIDRLKTKNFGALTEDLRIEIDFMEKNTGAGAEYDIGKDILIFYSGGLVTNPDETLYHELGHRLYYKYLTENARSNGTSFLSNAKIEVTKKDVTDFVDKFQSILNRSFIQTKWDDDEGVRYFLYTNDVDIDLIGKYHALLFGFYNNIMGETKKEYSRNEILNILNNFIGNKVNKYFITDYSNKNPSEAFAEVFKQYISGKFQKQHPVVKELFKDIVRSTNKFDVKESKLNLMMSEILYEGQGKKE